MTLRRRLTTGDDHAKWFAWASDDAFARGYFGQGLFSSPEAAAAMWPACRRSVWSVQHRQSIPRGGRVFDGLTRKGWHLAWSRIGGGAIVPSVAAVVEALAEDRRAVAAFERRDPAGARAIGDFLAMWRADLDAVEQHVRSGDGGVGPLSISARYEAPDVLGQEWAE